MLIVAITIGASIRGGTRFAGGERGASFYCLAIILVVGVIEGGVEIEVARADGVGTKLSSFLEERVIFGIGGVGDGPIELEPDAAGGIFAEGVGEAGFAVAGHNI